MRTAGKGQLPTRQLTATPYLPIGARRNACDRAICTRMKMRNDT
jgi:hypothetical protein